MGITGYGREDDGVTVGNLSAAAVVQVVLRPWYARTSVA